ncbi:unnamed protein product [Leptidea sinapis]|uniref:Transferrin-like domain-containing protein n=1 Tax=Leptidea sinapis TaxID=189913 RepID=A0A5E4QCF2_9NEOP|nr:unnamed protein product [Leptidea sinapis]
MTLKLIIFYLLALTALNVECKTAYKICVPAQYMKQCEDMLEVPTKSKALLECIPARDRMECLSFVQQRQADFVPVDPEDMYVASKIPNQDFVVFQEYRTDEEPDAEFRYEAVIVVHKDLNINSLDQLKGLKSCHTGVNRNVGYKTAQYHPRRMNCGRIPHSSRKSQYSQLCALCEHPDKCDYPDNFSGYEGALRCLAHNGGEVAFTKVIFVRKFFGLPVGTSPATQSTENPDEFAYLCVDGSKVPIRDKPCSWAARPWQGLIGHNDVLAKLTPLREKIKQLAVAEKIHHVADNIAIKPADYLSKANYTEVIERGHGPPEPIVRLCVTSNVAVAKCRAMSVFAFSRDIRPKLDCVQEPTEDDCLKSQYNLHPVFHEVYGDTKIPNYAVAVVKKDASFNKLDDLRGRRSCHNSFATFSGLQAPLYLLINKQLIKSDQTSFLVLAFRVLTKPKTIPEVRMSQN